MADNVTANAGSGGATFAADEILSVHYPRTKIVIGADGTNDGDVSSANPLPVSDAGGSFTVDAPVTTPVFVRLSDGTNAIATLPVSAAQSGSWTVDTELTTADLDTGAGTDTRAVVGLVYGASGGAVLVSAANGLPVLDTNSAAIKTAVETTATSIQVIDNAAVEAGTAISGTGMLVVGGTDGTDFRRISTNASGHLNVATVAAVTAISNALPAGTNTIGQVGLATRTSGGLTPHRTISAATTNATSVKASAGQVYGVYAHNTNAAVRYLKLYNKASAPTVGTDAPVLTLPIPGNTAGAGFMLNNELGIAFATGIAFALTTGVADSDTAAVAANEVLINLLYA